MFFRVLSVFVSFVMSSRYTACVNINISHSPSETDDDGLPISALWLAPNTASLLEHLMYPLSNDYPLNDVYTTMNEYNRD